MKKYEHINKFKAQIQKISDNINQTDKDGESECGEALYLAQLCLTQAIDILNDWSE